jgi:hypothetical protein
MTFDAISFHTFSFDVYSFLLLPFHYCPLSISLNISNALASPGKFLTSILGLSKDISASITMKFGNRSIKPAKPERSKSLKKLIKGGKLNKGQIAQVNKLHQAFISAVESGKVTDKVMNIRGIERALALACAFPDVFRFRDLLEFTVFNGCEDDEIHILRTITNDIVDF